MLKPIQTLLLLGLIAASSFGQNCVPISNKIEQGTPAEEGGPDNAMHFELAISHFRGNG